MKRVIICPDDVKKKRLTNLYSKNVINEDFYITLEQLKEKMFFKITTEAKLFARDFLKVKYSVAITMINNLYYIDNDYKHENLEILRDLKKELIKRNLLIFDNLFPFYLKRYNVLVTGYLLSKNDMVLIDEVKKYTNVEIENVSYKYKKLDVYKYNSIEDEVDDIFKKITNLINSNVGLNNIKICNINNDYIHLLRRYSEFYNIKINFKKQDSLLSSTIVNKFLNLYNDNKNLVEIIEQLKLRYKNNDIVKKIVNLINDVNSENDLTDVFLYEFEKLKYDELRYDNAIEIVDFYNYQFNKENFVFILNFNNSTLPREYKDDQYLSDNITKNINLDTTSDKIKLELEQIKIKLFNIENIYISYKVKTKSKEYMPSRLINILEMNVINEVINIEYSNIKVKLQAGILLENFIKYDELNKDLFKYYYLVENDFNTYKNVYKKVDVKLVKEKLDNKIKLSYTSLSTYFKCSFAFYLERILKIKIDNGNFASNVGTIFHEILENLNNENYDYLSEINNHKEDFKTNKEKFFYEKLSEEFIETIEIIKSQQQYTSLKSELYEEKVIIESEVKFKREFVGLVDKVIYSNINSKDYLAVIDYKTGNVSASLNNIEDGFNLQLPIYAYMLKKTNKFKNPIVLGMFLQQILNKIPKYDSKVSVEKNKIENLKLKGFVIGEENLEILDNEYQDSKMISKLKMNKKGDSLDTYAKVITEEQFDELANLVDKLINDAFDNIENLDFSINPKLISNVNESCMFCKYDSICFKNQKNNIYLEKTNFLKKGEKNGLDDTTTISD